MPYLSRLNVRYVDLLKNFDSLPPTAIVPIPVAAAWRGVSEKTIRRNFPLVQTSESRRGVRKADLLIPEVADAAA
jgi:hypothetical protein